MEQNFIYKFLLMLLLKISSLNTQDSSDCSKANQADILLDTARKFISRAKQSTPINVYEVYQPISTKTDKSSSFLNTADILISSARTNLKCECSNQPLRPVDCSEIFRFGQRQSGVYTIWPRNRLLPNGPVNVYCDMDTDGGGWTVIQRRGNFSSQPKDFKQRWATYRAGFGDLMEEFWLGNDYLHAISNQAHYEIRFDLVDAEGVRGYAQYYSFYIEEETSNYKIHIEGYDGNVGNGMAYSNNCRFSTWDRDNDDNEESSCPMEYEGGWWYNKCAYANLNGVHQPGVYSVGGITWFQWRNWNSLSRVEIKLRPSNFQSIIPFVP